MKEEIPPRMEMTAFNQHGEAVFSDTMNGVVLAHRGNKTQAIFALLDAPDDMTFTIVENRPRTEEEWGSR